MADTTKIKPCDCENKSQDELYGKSNRVHNLGERDAKCTVCGKKTKK